MNTPNEQIDASTEGRATARKGLIVLACAIGVGTVLLISLALIGGRTSPARTASFQPLKAETTQAQAPVAAPATTETVAAPAEADKVRSTMQLVGVDLSNCPTIARLSSKDGKLTVHYEDCAQVLWTKGKLVWIPKHTNQAVATAEGGSK